jgi:acyl-CoA synthetase (AMP-forming)/AMP-acid ligase II
MADPRMPSVVPGPAAGAVWAGSGHATFPDHLPTVAALLRHSCDHHRHNLAVATLDERLTYEELDRRSAAMAALLVARGVGKGTKVGILLPQRRRMDRHMGGGHSDRRRRRPRQHVLDHP